MIHLKETFGRPKGCQGTEAFLGASASLCFSAAQYREVHTDDGHLPVGHSMMVIKFGSASRLLCDA